VRWLLLAATAWVAALAFGSASPAAPGSSPALRLVDATPLTVRGTGFAGHERVRLRLKRESGVVVRRAQATATGRFVVRFGVAVAPCPTWVVVARGGLGSRATLRPDPRQDCAQP
jgi:hypothetical protein